MSTIWVPMVDKLHSDKGPVEFRVFLMEEGLPFLVHEEHEDGVAGWSIDRAKGHDIESAAGPMGSSKAKLFAVAVADTNLMEARLGINADPVETAGAWSKVGTG